MSFNCFGMALLYIKINIKYNKKNNDFKFMLKNT